MTNTSPQLHTSEANASNEPQAAWRDRPGDYPIYKPNSRGDGGVIRFGLNLSKRAIFVDAASQNGERQFDWDNKVTMKWGLSDIGEVLSVLRGRIPQAKLFHRTDKANSAVEFARRDDPELAPFFMTLSRQEAADKSLRRVSIPVTHAEAAVLEVLLQGAVTQMVGW